MATTTNFTVGPAWVHVASGRADGQVVKIETEGDFFIAVSVGGRSLPPDIPALSGHRITGKTSIPLVAAQHLWACASTPKQITVT